MHIPIVAFDRSRNPLVRECPDRRPRDDGTWLAALSPYPIAGKGAPSSSTPMSVICAPSSRAVRLPFLAPKQNTILCAVRTIAYHRAEFESIPGEVKVASCAEGNLGSRDRLDVGLSPCSPTARPQPAWRVPVPVEPVSRERCPRLVSRFTAPNLRPVSIRASP